MLLKKEDLLRLLDNYSIPPNRVDNEDPNVYEREIAPFMVRQCKRLDVKIPYWLQGTNTRQSAERNWKIKKYISKSWNSEENKWEYFYGNEKSSRIPRQDIVKTIVAIGNYTATAAEFVEIEKSNILQVWELEKAIQEELGLEIKKRELTGNIPLKITPQVGSEFWWVQYQPRDYHGRYVRTGKMGPDKPAEKQITRIQKGAMVIFKANPKDEHGHLAEVVEIMGPKEKRTYKIKLGTDNYQVVKKSELIKPHHDSGGRKRDMIAYMKESDPHKMPNSSPEGMPESEVMKLYNENKDAIIHEAKKIYGNYINIGINLNQHGISMEDLAQEAQLEAIRRTPKWDAERGEYIPFIQQWVRFSLSKYISDKSSSWGMIKIPRQKKEQLARLKAHKQEIVEQESRQPTLGEMSAWAKDNLGISEDQTRQLMNLPEAIYSLYTVVPGKDQDDNEQELVVNIAADTEKEAESRIERQEAYDGIVKYLDKHLTEEESTVIKLRFGIELEPGEREEGPEKTTEEISQIMTEMGFKLLSQQRVSELVASALEKLQKSNKFKQLLLDRHNSTQKARHFVVPH